MPTFFDAAMSRQQERLAATRDMVEQRRRLIAALDPQPGERILDVGCGNGVLARDIHAIVGPRGEVAGIDASEPMIAMARHLSPDCAFELADAASLPFETASRDGVVAAQVLCFLPDVDAALTEMFRVLRPGGRLVILDTDWGSLVWNARDGALMQKAVEVLTAPYVDASVPRGLSPRLSRAGFAIAERTAYPILNWDAGPDSYAGQTAGYVVPMIEASERFTAAEVADWQSDQEQMARDGAYLFCLTRFLFVARKPAAT